jgi:hypothetical protein
VAGQGKVGIAGFGTSSFLELSPAVRANGMGQAGVALTDNYSSYFNPAAVGLLHEKDRFQFTFYPSRADFDTDGFFQLEYWAGSLRLISGPIGDNWSFRLNLAYAHTRLKSYILMANYSNPMGEWSKMIDRTHSVTLSMSVSAITELGIGITWKNIYESFENESASGHGFDFGIMARLPSNRLGSVFEENRRNRWYFSPSIGISWCNVGPDIRIKKYEFPLPYFYRAGMAVPFGFEKEVNLDHLMLFKVTPAMELMRYPGEEEEDKFGLELTIVNAVSARIGRLEKDFGYAEVKYDTWGIGINSQGLVRLFTDIIFKTSSNSYGAILKMLRNDIKLEFSFSRKNLHVPSGYIRDHNEDFYGLSISY